MTPLPDTAVARLRAAGCVFAEDEARLLAAEASSAAELDAMVERRATGVPLEQVLGWAEFCGLRIALAPRVFVPRRRSELLARQAIALVRPGSVVVDLCCGSGALGVAVASAVPDVELHVADIDPAAVACARRNVAQLGRSAHLGDLYRPLPSRLRGRVDLVLGNAPYVPTAELDLMPAEARVHEPVTALDGGRDGLDVQRRLIEEAPRWLAPGGHLLVETSRRQASTTVELVARAGLDPRVVTDQELEATVVVGTVTGSR